MLVHLCQGGSWLAPACASPQAGGLQWTLSLLAMANLWAFYHFFRVSRHHSTTAESTRDPQASLTAQ